MSSSRIIAEKEIARPLAEALARCGDAAAADPNPHPTPPRERFVLARQRCPSAPPDLSRERGLSAAPLEGRLGALHIL
eukprot:1420102-Prymnesium_polylepis.1